MTELDPEAKRLLDLARDEDRGTAVDRRRVRARLSRTLGAATLGSAVAGAAKAGAASGASAGAPAVGKLAAWAVAGMMTGFGGIAAVQSLSDENALPRRAPVAIERAERASNPGAAEGRTWTPPERAAEEQEPPSSGRKPRTDEGQTLEPAEEESARGKDQSSSLAEETRLLEAAHAALSGGDAAAAVALLDRHESRFPAGLLREERLAAQSIAQCRLGNREKALRSAEALRAASPRSPLWPRVAAACDLPAP